MLQLRPNCEHCDTDLGPDAANAYICSFECTFCHDCTEEKLGRICPNCGGELVSRPTRNEALLKDYPASTKRVRAKSQELICRDSLAEDTVSVPIVSDAHF